MDTAKNLLVKELAIARDTQAILKALAPAKEAPAAAAEAAPPAGDRPDDIARLLLLWAQDREADDAALAQRWSREIGRTVDAAAVKSALERLNLSAGRIGKSAERRKKRTVKG